MILDGCVRKILLLKHISVKISEVIDSHDHGITGTTKVTADHVILYYIVYDIYYTARSKMLSRGVQKCCGKHMYLIRVFVTPWNGIMKRLSRPILAIAPFLRFFSSTSASICTGRRWQWNEIIIILLLLLLITQPRSRFRRRVRIILLCIYVVLCSDETLLNTYGQRTEDKFQRVKVGRFKLLLFMSLL